MNCIRRYLVSQVVRSISVVLLMLVVLSFFIQLVSELSDIGSQHYGVLAALLYVLMHIPQSVYQFFPIAGLLGSLVGLGQLAAKSELVAMQAAGVSVRQITWAVCQAALYLLVLMVICGEVLAPWLDTQAQLFKARQLRKVIGSQTGGAWLRQGNYYIHYAQHLSDAQVADVLVFDLNKMGELVSALSAREAVKINDQTWQLQSVKKTIFLPDRIDVLKADKMPIVLHLDPQALSLSLKDDDHLSFPELWNKMAYNKSIGLSVVELSYAFWQRLFAPLVGLIMICLGVPFIFGALRHVSMGARLLIGTFIGFFFYMFNQMMGPVGMVLHLSPILSASFPFMCFLLVYWRLSSRILR